MSARGTQKVAKLFKTPFPPKSAIENPALDYADVILAIRMVAGDLLRSDKSADQDIPSRRFSFGLVSPS
jgi:hypothetical protein